MEADASDDELSDSDEANATYELGEQDSSNKIDKESFMDVLAALIVSEEFQGIVASEMGNSKLFYDLPSTGSTISRPRSLNADSIPSNLDRGFEDSGDAPSKTCHLQDQPYFGLL